MSEEIRRQLMSIDWDDHDHIELKILKDTLVERVELLDYLGGGGFGKVFKIKDKTDSELYALKVLKLYKLSMFKDSTQEEFHRRFIEEALAYQKCIHPNIVFITEVGGCGLCPYIIMEYVDGKNLDKMIDEKGNLELKQILEISQSVLPAVEYMHSIDLIHRDLKPTNIMIWENNGQIKIIDFGIVKNLTTSTITQTGSIMGSPYYISPEQWKDSKHVDSRTDIYSYGVTLYQMVTGQVPFEGNNPEVMDKHLSEPVPDVKKINPAAPPGIQKIIKKAMAKTPGKRFQKPGDLLTALKKIDK
jgi:serine/threonine protein kinase